MQIFYLLMILSSIGLICGQTVHNVALKVGPPYEGIKNPGYPTTLLPYDSFVQWNLVVESDSTIKITCDDVRMTQSDPWTADCPFVYLSFDEGNRETKVCGRNKAGYQYRSKGPKLTVKFASIKEGSGLIRCSAYSTKEPPSIDLELQPNGPIHLIATPERPAPHWDKVWTLKSTPNSRISFQCSMTFNSLDDNTCYKDIMTFDDGEEVTEYCKTENIVLFSKKNVAKLRIQLNELGDENLRCIVQAVTGPHPDQFNNVEPDETDSSEHGVNSGTKNTTCDCGRANRPPSRVTHGQEVRENEFPWMVLLYISFPIGNGGLLMSSCGASIITQRHVLTAAHCIVRRDSNEVARPENVRMVLAEHHRYKISGHEKEIVGEQLFVHQNYHSRRTHDIGIIFTKEMIEFSLLIGPVCLSPVSLPVLNKRIQIMGWGQTETGQASEVLRKSKAVVIDRSACRMPEWEICTKAVPSATCFGDSGGPQVWVDPETNRYTQVSLASRAAFDCRSYPNTQTDVTFFYSWIQNVIQQTDPSQMICQKIN